MFAPVPDQERPAGLQKTRKTKTQGISINMKSNVSTQTRKSDIQRAASDN